MSLLRRWAFPAALVCLVGSLAVWRLVPWLTRFRWALLIAGGLLLLTSLALNAGALRAASGRRAARYGAGAAVLIVLALGVAVLANALSVRHNARWDLTENRRQSLSPQSIKVLGSLPGPVEAIAFFRGDTPGRRTAEDLLKLYASYSNGKLTWRMEDPDRSPGLAQRYGVDTYGTVILERRDKMGDKGAAAKSEKVLDADEERITNGLLKLTRDAKRVIYLLKGHGESDAANTERPGFSQAKEQMEKANYEVKELTLARDPTVPADAAIIIVAGPKTDLLAPELAALDGFIGGGGKAFFMLAPFQADGLRKYLARYGFEVGDDLVVELNPIGRAFGLGPEVPVVTQYEPHPITRDLGGLMTLFPLSRSVDVTKAPAKGTTVQALARTSAQSWGETDKNALQRGEAKADPSDKPGPLPVAAVAIVDAATPTPAAATPGAPAAPAAPAPKDGDAPDAAKKPAKARLVVIGTANLASNQFLGAQGNRDFFLNVVSWLAEDESQISVRARDTKSNPIVLSPPQAELVLWLPVAILPGAVALVGILAVVGRRRRSR
ncbi:MAG TPA: Gldg family protein [Pseudomonadales bacterium]|nr:Gldg family protein [Pseudomonadales bacterium]